MKNNCPYCLTEITIEQSGMCQCKTCCGRYLVSSGKITSFNKKEIRIFAAIPAVVMFILFFVNGVSNEIEDIGSVCLFIALVWFALSEVLQGWFVGKITVRHVTLTRKDNQELFLFYLFFLALLAGVTFIAGILKIFGVIN